MVLGDTADRGVDGGVPMGDGIDIGVPRDAINRVFTRCGWIDRVFTGGIGVGCVVMGSIGTIDDDDAVDVIGHDHKGV